MITRFFRGGLLLLALHNGASTYANTVVSGHFDRPAQPLVTLTFQADDFSPGLARQVQSPVDAQGNFRLELPALAAPHEVVLDCGPDTRLALYLEPGDNLRVTIDTAQVGDNLHFAGTGAVANTYLAQASGKFDEQGIGAIVGVATLAITMPAAQACPLLDADRQERLAFLRTFAATHPLTPAFRAYARQSITFRWAEALLQYDRIRRQWYKQGKAWPLPAGYFNFLAAVRPAQDSALRTGNGCYASFLRAYAITRLLPPTQPTTGASMLAAARQQFGTGRSYCLALHYCIQNLLDTRDVNTLTPLLPAYLRATPDSAAVQEVRNAYRRRLPVSAGRIAPAFAVRDETGKTVRLADFKGKVVYLNFWSNTCEASRENILYASATTAQLKGREVVFLFVCTDPKEAGWHDVLTAQGLASAHGDGIYAWDHSMARASSAYHITSTPTSFLIGRDGRIITERPLPLSADSEAVAELKTVLAK